MGKVSKCEVDLNEWVDVEEMYPDKPRIEDGVYHLPDGAYMYRREDGHVIYGVEKDD